MNREALDELERLAREATPGPWRECGAERKGVPCTCGQVWSTEADHIVAVTALSERDYGEVPPQPVAQANARYVAAANPSSILALLEYIHSLEGRERDVAEYLFRTLPFTETHRWGGDAAEFWEGVTRCAAGSHSVSLASLRAMTTGEREEALAAVIRCRNYFPATPSVLPQQAPLTGAEARD